MASTRHLAIIVSSCLGTLACDGNPLDPLPSAFGSKIYSGELVLDEVAALGAATPADPIPPGNATYHGFAGYMLAPLATVPEADFKANPGDYADYVADVTLSVDFGAGVTSGRFSNFIDREGSIPGSLTIAPVGLADVGGDLAFATTASGEIDGDPTSVSVEAYFVGPAAEGVLGRGEGSMGGSTISHYFVGTAD